MSKAVNILFPHQLFRDSELLSNDFPIYLVEEFLFFKLYKFHKQKIAFHRASMKAFAHELSEFGKEVHYIDSTQEESDIRALIPVLKNNGFQEFHVIDPTDNWLEKHLRSVTHAGELKLYESPLFINSKSDLKDFFRSDKKFYFQTTFYKNERVRLNILVDKDQNPAGGQWTYDSENRKKFPKKKSAPVINFPSSNKYWKEAIDFVETNYADYPGELSTSPVYPIDVKQAKDWFDQFLNFRFHEFGDYEDAIVRQEMILHHSVLSPLINVGLLSPIDVVQKALDFAKENNVPLNSLEGFVRQIIGWREFVRGMYESRGTEQRTTNFWNFNRKIPDSFYNGTTGIDPIDETIKKVLKTGYCHHIERLMVLGNFMLICEFDPDDVYQWFMELFIDAYDWVMVPNVYGMSQFADGGLFATKPYIGGSNYIKKMSDYPKGDWEPIWDGLFWRFVHEHQDFFKGNPRMSMMYHSMKRMDDAKIEAHLKNAETFLNKLDQS